MVKEFNKNFRIGQGGLVTVTADFTILSTNKPRLVLVDATAGPITVTLPLASGVGGKRTCIIKVDSSGNAVTIAANAADTVNGAATDSVSNQFENVDYISDNENAWFKVAIGSGGGGGMGGNTEVVLDQAIASDLILHTFNFDRSVAMNGSDVGMVIVVISNLQISGADIIDVQFNGESFSGTNVRGVSSDGSSLAPVLQSNGISDGIAVSTNGSWTCIIELPGFLAISGNNTGVFAKWSDSSHYASGRVDLQTAAFDPLVSIQIRTRNGIQTINTGTRIVVYAINKN